MIALIAESKTMNEEEKIFPITELNNHRPCGDSEATEIMKRLSEMSIENIMGTIKVSSQMARRILKFAYEFPNKASGMTAIEAFTGVVFKALNYDNLSKGDKDSFNNKVRIISSLYGWLKPEDIIKPYRLEFKTKVAPNDKTLADYWKKDVTIKLVKEIQTTGCEDILDLMPGDAAKCIDRKLIKRFAKIWKVDFKELKEGGEFATPNAGKLKKLRGELLREIITRKISSPQELLTLSTDTFLPLGTPDFPDHIAFCV